MKEPVSLVRIPSLKSVEDFRRHAASLGLEIPCDDAILAGPASPLLEPVADITINGKRLANRWAVQPMEGWMAPRMAASPMTCGGGGSALGRAGPS